MTAKTSKSLRLSLIIAAVIAATGTTAYFTANSQYLANVFGEEESSTTTTTETTVKTDSSVNTTSTDGGKAEAVVTTSSTYNSDEHPMFSLYGAQKPDTKEQLCSFLDSRLHDSRVLTPHVRHRYQTDWDNNCVETAEPLRASAPEQTPTDWSKFPYSLQIQNGSGAHSFLREASSGIQALNLNVNIFTLLHEMELANAEAAANN